MLWFYTATMRCTCAYFCFKASDWSIQVRITTQSTQVRAIQMDPQCLFHFWFHPRENAYEKGDTYMYVELYIKCNNWEKWRKKENDDSCGWYLKMTIREDLSIHGQQSTDYLSLRLWSTSWAKKVPIIVIIQEWPDVISTRTNF